MDKNNKNDLLNNENPSEGFGQTGYASGDPGQAGYGQTGYASGDPNQGGYGYGQTDYGYGDYGQYAPQGSMPYNPYTQEIPPEIRKWNWGAFMFTLMWGIGNHAYLTFLMFVPCLNFVWPFICGGFGNRWAWRSGEFKDVETFLAVQKTWNRAGFVSFIIAIAFTVLMILALALGLFNFIRAYQYYGWF
jgi:hypothetical protein